MIEIKNLNKYYTVGKGKNKTQFHALKDINLSICEGKSVALQGKSGAGKSTLLNILGLIDNYDSGTFMLDGIDVGQLKDTAAAHTRNQKIGFVLQDFSLIDSKSVLINTMLPLYFTKCSTEEMKTRAMSALSAVGIEDQADKKTIQLSGGQRQRVAIARALITNPKLILADEPTGSLDGETSKQIMDLLMTLNREKGITLIVVTHDDEIAQYCEKKILIEDGKLIE